MTLAECIGSIRRSFQGCAAGDTAFERSMRMFLAEDAVRSQSFTKVWPWRDRVEDFARTDDPDIRSVVRGGRGVGVIDLVARINPEGPEGCEGFRAIQCKFFGKGTGIAAEQVRKFPSTSSNRTVFPRPLRTETGIHEWGANAGREVEAQWDGFMILNFDSPEAPGAPRRKPKAVDDPIEGGGQRERLHPFMASALNEPSGRMLQTGGNC